MIVAYTEDPSFELMIDILKWFKYRFGHVLLLKKYVEFGDESHIRKVLKDWIWLTQYKDRVEKDEILFGEAKIERDALVEEFFEGHRVRIAEVIATRRGDEKTF